MYVRFVMVLGFIGCFSSIWTSPKMWKRKWKNDGELKTWKNKVCACEPALLLRKAGQGSAVNEKRPWARSCSQDGGRVVFIAKPAIVLYQEEMRPLLYSLSFLRKLSPVTEGLGKGAVGISRSRHHICMFGECKLKLHKSCIWVIWHVY